MFFALLRKGINEELPGWPEVVVVFDGQDGSAQRKETDSGYKANRPASDRVLKPIRALPAVKAGLDLFAITWVEVNDAEADDVIATLAANCPERDVLIASPKGSANRRVRVPPTAGEVETLFTGWSADMATARKYGPAARNYTAMRLASLIGPRISELCLLNMGDIYWEQGEFGKLLLTGKGSRGRSGKKERLAPMINGARELLEWWVTGPRWDFGPPDQPDAPVFPSERRSRDGSSTRVSPPGPRLPRLPPDGNLHVRHHCEVADQIGRPLTPVDWNRIKTELVEMWHMAQLVARSADNGRSVV